MTKKGDYAFPFVNACILLAVAAATLFPFLHMLAVSLSSNDAVLAGEVTLFPKGFQLKLYANVLADTRVRSGYVNTIVYVTLGTAVSMIVTSMGAYALAKQKLVFRKGFMLMIVFTILFGGGMIPTFLVVNSLGIVNTVWAMALPTAVNTWNLIIMRTFFANVPEELEEAGRMDGLTDLGIFARIVLPLSKPILATVGLFYAVAIWNNFYSALLYLRDVDKFPLQLHLRNILIVPEANITQAGGDQQLPKKSLQFATIIVSSLPILLVYPFLQKYFVKGALIGSVKG
ncbi:MAG: carbohydrate ABC transporter permease [Paenibacillaceae bacterium]|nr:carbohydrate ABC transporter permease [Paenibacillaceae bacterium]